MHRDTRQCRGVLAGCGHMDSAVLRRLVEPHPRLRLTPENTGHLRREKSVDRFTGSWTTPVAASAVSPTIRETYPRAPTQVVLPLEEQPVATPSARQTSSMSSGERAPTNFCRSAWRTVCT